MIECLIIEWCLSRGTEATSASCTRQQQIFCACCLAKRFSSIHTHGSVAECCALFDLYVQQTDSDPFSNDQKDVKIAKNLSDIGNSDLFQAATIHETVDRRKKNTVIQSKESKNWKDCIRKQIRLRTVENRSQSCRIFRHDRVADGLVFVKHL